MYKITYSIEQLHRGYWTYEDRSETSKTSFNEDQVRTQETYEHKDRCKSKMLSITGSVCMQECVCVCVCVCVCATPTLKKGRDDVTVHQGLDVVLSAHG